MRPPVGGDTTAVFSIAIALVVIGLVLGFLIPPYGFVVAVIGILLFVLYLLGVGRTVSRT